MDEILDTTIVQFDPEERGSSHDPETRKAMHRRAELNCSLSALLTEYVSKRLVPASFVRKDSERTHVTRKVQEIPLEVVVRNIAAGSLVKKRGFKKKHELIDPIVEYRLKDKSLSDPLLNEDHIRELEIASFGEMTMVRKLSLVINNHMLFLFEKCALTLVDFKIEFGREDRKIVLTKMFTVDSSRIRDAGSEDRPLRFDFMNLTAWHEEVYRRISEFITRNAR